MPLLDAAPLIAAAELGYFADEDLAIVFDRQIGWGNVRDKLTFGQLDAAHALVGMPLFSVLGRDWFAEPLVAVMNLGSGGDAITLSRRLTEMGVTSAGLLAEWLRRGPFDFAQDRPKRMPPVLAHVFSCSMHHYLLRDWLASAGIDPDRDVSLCVLPPPQMAGHMGKGYLDGFCVGEPWGTLAEREGSGSVVAASTDLVPAHAEKSLVVSRRWAAEHAALLPRMIKAVLRACQFCEDVQNYSRLCEILSRPEYLGLPAEVISDSLNLGRRLSSRRERGRSIRSDWKVRSFSPQSTFPSGTHYVWLMEQMVRWGHRSPIADAMATARKCIDTAPYRAAVASMGIECPATDFPSMPLRNGLFDPAAPSSAVVAAQEK